MIQIKENPEWWCLLSGLGIFAVGISLFLSSTLVSDSHLEIPDPFIAEYDSSPKNLAQALLPPKEELKLPSTNLKALINLGKNNEPTPVVEVPETRSVSTPALTGPIGAEKFRAFLMAPGSQQILRRPRHDSSGYSVEFRFETYPKDMPAVFELYRQNKRILTQDGSPNTNGPHSIKVQLKDPGVYEWRVTAEAGKGELRSFTLSP
jgi:hypothetical protein